MKRIVIDDGLCMGSKECLGIAPQAVELDDDGISHPTGVAVPDDVAERLASSCPGMAIEIADI